jgi:hypothetical protein
MHWAASSDDAEALIHGGADIEAPGGSIGTLLDNAVGDGCWWHVARLLTARGARGTRLLLLPTLLYLLARSSEEKLGGRFSIACPLSVVLGPWPHRYGPAKLDFPGMTAVRRRGWKSPDLQRCP